MNGKLPLFTSKALVKILDKLGFQLIRQKGSHVYLKHKDGRSTVVPLHAGKQIGRGLLKRIINEIDMPREDFIKFAKGNK